MEWGTEGTNNGWVSVTLCFVGCANPLLRMAEDVAPPEDLRARFYEHYHKAVKEYNRKSVTKYLMDLAAVLIYVSLAHCSDTYVLT